jgi:hypothetical protein
MLHALALCFDIVILGGLLYFLFRTSRGTVAEMQDWEAAKNNRWLYKRFGRPLENLVELSLRRVGLVLAIGLAACLAIGAFIAWIFAIVWAAKFSLAIIN